MEDIFGGVWDFFAGIVEWTPDVIEVAEIFVPDGESSTSQARPANRRDESPQDEPVDE